MSTVCDRFGKTAGQQGGENELNKANLEERVDCTRKKKGGGGKWQKNRVRGEHERASYYTERKRERE